LIILDTHAFVWYIDNPKLLSKKALERILATVDNGLPVLVSSITIWELCILTLKERLKIEGGVESWLDNVLSLTEFEYVPVNNSIAIESAFLPGNFHADPADRIIVATSRLHNATIITKDKKIRDYSHVDSLW
jgi:PIN domain nuclease of toxin-antitoxin system